MLNWLTQLDNVQETSLINHRGKIKDDWQNSKISARFLIRCDHTVYTVYI